MGSKRIPLKNRELVGGVSLWERALKTALEAGVFSQVVVSSDDPVILEAAGPYALRRPAELASDNATTREVVAHALDMTGSPDGHSAVLQPTTPEMTTRDIRRATEACVFWPGNVCTVNLDGSRNGFYVMSRLVDFRRLYIAITTDSDYIDINEPSDLEEVRRRFAKK
jgi:CMP-2-keto-3-deoxyoctulosonic acid synthetase